jgi:GMP synthase (glutamine-hydrolysing)
MKAIYILKTGDTFEHIKAKYGDFEDWILKHITSSSVKIKTVNVPKEESLPLVEECAGVIITGSHAMVSDELIWSLKLEKYLQNLKEEQIPMLGICYGHQLLAKALGGESKNNPKGKEVGTAVISFTCKDCEDTLFSTVPTIFWAHTTHMQTATVLPQGSVSFASSQIDNNHIVKFAKNVWGVQFHPEFDEEIMREYIKAQEESLKKEGLNVQKLLEAVKPTPWANSVLDNFVEFVKEESIKKDK